MHNKWQAPSVLLYVCIPVEKQPTTEAPKKAERSSVPYVKVSLRPAPSTDAPNSHYAIHPPAPTKTQSVRHGAGAVVVEHADPGRRAGGGGGPALVEVIVVKEHLFV